MRHPLRRLLGILGFGALASQAGHLLAYEVQFGAVATAIQSQGAHAYFPMIAKTSLGLAMAVLLAGILVVGAARLASGSPFQKTSSPAFMPLLSTLFTVQVTVFIAQETIEAAVAGTAAPHVVALLLIGTLGQLPIAVGAALAIKWLAARVEFAVVSLRLDLRRATTITLAQHVSVPRQNLAVQAALAEASPASFVKRGPPRRLRD